jgi:hypothetical protein
MNTNTEVYDPEESMDIDNMTFSKNVEDYFSLKIQSYHPPPPRHHQHPKDGIISSRILPDESNLVRFGDSESISVEIPLQHQQ